MGYFASVLFRMICLPNLKRKILLFFFIIRQGYLQKWSVPREVGKITVRWESPPFAVSGDVQDLIGVFLKKYIASKQAKQFLFIETLCYFVLFNFHWDFLKLLHAKCSCFGYALYDLKSQAWHLVQNWTSKWSPVSLSIWFLPSGCVSALFSLLCDVELLAFAGAGDVSSACTTDQLCISWPLQSTI